MVKKTASKIISGILLCVLLICSSIRGHADTGAAVPDGSSFTIHFIDVGQADAALVLCDDAAMLIDGGNKEDSSLIYTYLKNLAVDHLDYIVCTHPHEDHIGGLPAALNVATVDYALCPVTFYDSDRFEAFSTYLERAGVPITVPTPGDSFSLGSATVEVLGPASVTDDLNNSCIVLRITYGDTSFLFTGDAEYEEEQAILDSGAHLQSTVLKVGHHGSANSTSYRFLYEVMPQYAVISVGNNNPYGHPTEAALSRLRDADVKVYRTDLQGDVTCTSDGTSVSFSVEKNPDADTLAVQTVYDAQATPINYNPEAGIEYVLNTNSHKFHYLECPSVADMKEKNKQYYQGTREEVIAMGYDPCGRCKP